MYFTIWGKCALNGTWESLFSWNIWVKSLGKRRNWNCFWNILIIAMFRMEIAYGALNVPYHWLTRLLLDYSPLSRFLSLNYFRHKSQCRTEKTGAGCIGLLHIQAAQGNTSVAGKAVGSKEGVPQSPVEKAVDGSLSFWATVRISASPFQVFQRTFSMW